jgi:2-methylisocitrate lyase-like PEP mutase family enzyme
VQSWPTPPSRASRHRRVDRRCRCAYEAHSARLVEQAGLDAVYVMGYGASASLLGRPYIGLLSVAEMAGQARRLVQAVGVPVIADADNGTGMR